MSVNRDSDDEDWSSGKFSYNISDFKPTATDNMPSHLKKRTLDDGVHIPDSISHKNRARIVQLRERIDRDKSLKQEFKNKIKLSKEYMTDIENEIKRLNDILMFVPN